MTISKSITYSLATALLLVLGSVSFAMAADFTHVTFDGDIAVEGKAKSSHKATFKTEVPVTEVIEFLETDVIGDGLPPVCKDIRDLPWGEYDVKVDIKLPPEVGDFDLMVEGFGIFGVTNTTVGCDPANSVGSETFSDVIHVMPGSSSNNDDVDSADDDSIIGRLLAKIDALLARIDDLENGTGGSGAMASDWSYLQYGSTGPAVVALQTYLMQNGFVIPALTQGAQYGYYGTQTAAAYTQAVSAGK